jgi:hypothetical protein
MTGMPGRGCRGGASPTPQIWAEQLTLSIIQGGGQIMPSIVLLVPPGFLDLSTSLRCYAKNDCWILCFLE